MLTNELWDLCGLSRASLSHEYGRLVPVQHFNEVVFGTPYRQLCRTVEDEVEMHLDLSVFRGCCSKSESTGRRYRNCIGLGV